jgi:hypothetical protein
MRGAFKVIVVRHPRKFSVAQIGLFGQTCPSMAREGKKEGVVCGCEEKGEQPEKACCPAIQKDLGVVPQKKECVSLCGAWGPLLGSVGVVKVAARVDVGMGNWITIRGRGAGLSWERGIPLKNEGVDKWTWEGYGLEGIEFKILINDVHWEKGENHACCCGSFVEIWPQF